MKQSPKDMNRAKYVILQDRGGSVSVKVVLDRFEGEYAVCEKEDLSILNIKRCIVPSEAKEGDVLNIDGEHVSIDTKETQKRKNEIDKLVEDLWE